MINKRSKCKTRVSFMLLIVSVIGASLSLDETLFYENSADDMLRLLVPIYFLTYVFKRAYVFFEELQHRKTRYDGHIQLILKLCFVDSCFICFLIIFLVYGIFMIIIWFKQLPLARKNGVLGQYLSCIFFTALLWASWETFKSQYFGKSNINMNMKLKAVPSMGSLWANAAYRSYFKPVVEDIRERICVFEKQYKVSIPLKKLVIIIPVSCDVRGTIDKYHPNIEYVDTLRPIVTDQGANVNRQYLNPVYKITFITEKPLYIAMEQPSSLLTLWKIRKVIPPDILHYQVNVFVKVLQEELQGSDCAILVYDDDAKESLCEFLTKNVRRILQEDKDKCQLNLV